jgi:hypothetical protein
VNVLGEPSVDDQAGFSRTRVVAAAALVVALAALLSRVGADSRWLATLGHAITTHGSIPQGVPFATAPTRHWPNTLVLAELVFNALERGFGDRGLMLAQLAAVGGALAMLAYDARAGGARAAGISLALLAAGVGVLPSLAIARVQMFSLVLFPVLVALLRSEARQPSKRIWLVLPLLALWSNLHGGALLGLAVLLGYLALSRARQQPLTAIGVAVCAPVALCLTPALGQTVSYYHGLVTNVAAQSGQGMWSPLSPSAPLDLVMIAAFVVLALGAWRARPALWEWAVLAALTLATVQASRNGVWLLFFLVAPAARASRAARSWHSLAPALAAASLALIAFAVVRGPADGGASPAVVARTLSLARGTPVLATGEIDEQIALAGGRIWVGNPVDAFSRADQTAYLQWLEGRQQGRRALGVGVRVVLVSSGSRTQALMNEQRDFRRAGGDRRTTIYERVGGAQGSLS